LKHLININVNDRKYEVAVKAGTTLLDLLRDELRLIGTKKGCELGDCGACTVLMEGKPVNSCIILALEADGKTITTIEGLAKNQELHPIQQAFVEMGAIQCGYCTPGMIMRTKALLDENPNPHQDEIIKALSGNLCRCTGYTKIFEAIEVAKLYLKGKRPQKI